MFMASDASGRRGDAATTVASDAPDGLDACHAPGGDGAATFAFARCAPFVTQGPGGFHASDVDASGHESVEGAGLDLVPARRAAVRDRTRVAARARDRPRLHGHGLRVLHDRG